jgi:hypothetical protein
MGDLLMAYRVELYSVPVSSSLDETIQKWNSGKDFKITGGPYCSIRDIEQLKRDFDIIVLKWVNEDMIVGYHTVYIHPLTSVTTYI